MGRALDHAGFLYPKGYLFGLTLSTAGGSATFGITAGEAVDSTGLAYMILPSAYTKTTAAWAVGSGNGASDAAIIANTWYHVYLIRRPDTGVVDILISGGATTPNVMPANYTQYRRIGSMKTNGSSQWTSFVQNGDYFTWLVRVQDLSGAAWNTTGTLTTLTVPVGISVEAFGTFTCSGVTTGGQTFIIYDPSVTDFAVGTFDGAGTAVSASFGAAIYFRAFTNTSGQLRRRSSDPSAIGTLYTFGWYDTRGKLQ